MSANETPPEDPRPDQWAPHDYTDGRSLLDWKSSYPDEARKRIRLEACYVFGFFVVYLALLFWALFYSLVHPETSPQNIGTSPTSQASISGWQEYLGYCFAWISGSLGGCLFGIKWMYHSVAKKIWHEDRRLWRLLTPHISGVVSLFMVLLVASGLLQIFDKNIVNRHTEILAFGFLVGYFSDKALAKMAEVADTLFGASNSHSKPRNSKSAV